MIEFRRYRFSRFGTVLACDRWTDRQNRYVSIVMNVDVRKCELKQEVVSKVSIQHMYIKSLILV